ncbi:MAG TPA: acyl-[acyl-carrier-protein]--UDP-N-acetylglucosamine O-acyltransferase [Verrucomicrobiales bacterium]|nr:acyl-[acyl-carrier-protein]--UDP-N-acetylglucosamine O-acyltransferase [Verrucomicrobiales bacterium]
MIHPTAIIHPGASIGDGCEIGPFCVIGEHAALGAGNRLHSHVVIEGHTVIGSRNEIFPFTTVGVRTQDLKWKGGTTWTRIGDDNTIREHVEIHSATGDGEETVIGSHNNILAGSHIAHNCVLQNHTILSSAGLAGHVLVEDYAIVGGKAVVHQFCRVGTMSIIGGVSKVVQDVPPYMMIDGNPAVTRTVNKVGLERRGVSDEAQKALRQAFKLLFKEKLTISNALARIAEELPQVPEIVRLAEFARTSERGLCK